MEIVCKNNDLVQDSGIWYKIVEKNEVLYAHDVKRPHIIKLLEKLDNIQEHKLACDYFSFKGATASVKAWVKDEEGILIYSEMIGYTAMVKSITSLLMQGRRNLKEHYISSSFSFTNVNKFGNRRFMSQLSDDVSHAILYHAPSIKQDGFDILIGRTDKEIEEMFSMWMERSQPIPYPKQLSLDIFKKLREKKLLKVLDSSNIIAIKIDSTLLEDEYISMQETILEVCEEKNFLKIDDSNFEFKLPTSSFLTKSQVQNIYDTLNTIPDLYEYDGLPIKKVGLKLFNHNRTYYIIESDKGFKDGESTTCFGYCVDECDKSNSEWGYVILEELLKFNFEKDLYFDDKFINNNGKVGKAAEL